MKCFPLMFFLFFLMKVYIVFSVRQENQQFNLSMMENPNLNTLYKLFQQNDNNNLSEQQTTNNNSNNMNFAQMYKFYQMMNAFTNSNNNNFSPLPSNSDNVMLLAQLNNMINRNIPPQPQVQQPSIDTNFLLKKLMSELQPRLAESSVPNQKLIPPLQKVKGNLRKKEDLFNTIPEHPKSDENLITEKLKEDIKKLQELTKEANKIMAEKVLKKEENNEDQLFHPENLLKQKLRNGPVKENINEINENIKNLQESIKVLPDNIVNTNTNINEIEMPDSTIIKNNFKSLSEFKNEIKNDEEEHRKDEFEDRLNYLLSKLDIISKINDK